MDPRRRVQAGPRAWTRLGCALVLASLVAAAMGFAGAWSGLLPAANALDGPLAWRADRLAAEPWRLWTAAFVHLSGLHLVANAVGGLLVVALGRAARLPASATWAWMLAWPLTHLGLLLASPALASYAGLSGVLHAGVACAAVHLVLQARPARLASGGSADAVAGPAPVDGTVGRSRSRIGWVILAMLMAKVLIEQPWIGGGGARWISGWDIPVASVAHASGVAAGIASSLAFWILPRGLWRG